MPTLVVYTAAPQEQALAVLRYYAVAQSVGWDVILGKEGTNRVYPERVHQADVVLVQRDFPRFFSAYLQILEEARAANVPVVYDVDDLLVALPADHPNRRDYEDSLGGIMYAMLTADQLVVSSPLLRDILRPLRSQIHIWPTVLPDALWTITPPQKKEVATPLRIGYMGSVPHEPDMALLVSPLCEFLDNAEQPVEFHFWGCPPPPALAAYAQTTHHPDISTYAEFAATFSTTADIDIWLAPLLPTLFNRCKSAIKFWEYSAIGGVGIYSDIDPYRAVVQHGENGLLADTPASWLAAVTRLANDPALRLKMATNAQQKLQNEGLLSAHAEAWQHIYTTPRPSTMAAPPLLPQAMLGFSKQVQQRAQERHEEMVGIIQVLRSRSAQLDAIYGSWWWRTWQRLKRMAHFDFSPSPPFQPFPVPDDGSSS